MEQIRKNRERLEGTPEWAAKQRNLEQPPPLPPKVRLYYHVDEKLFTDRNFDLDWQKILWRE